jgi:hypothetical protein
LIDEIKGLVRGNRVCVLLTIAVDRPCFFPDAEMLCIEIQSFLLLNFSIEKKV